jgi:hypothetical protein
LKRKNKKTIYAEKKSLNILSMIFKTSIDDIICKEKLNSLNPIGENPKTLSKRKKKILNTGRKNSPGLKTG